MSVDCGQNLCELATSVYVMANSALSQVTVIRQQLCGPEPAVAMPEGSGSLERVLLATCESLEMTDKILLEIQERIGRWDAPRTVITGDRPEDCVLVVDAMQSASILRECIGQVTDSLDAALLKLTLVNPDAGA